MDKQSTRNPRKFKPHGNYQPYGIGDIIIAMLPLSLSNTLNSSVPDTNMNSHDPMQTPGQTRIFYKVDRTHLTRTNMTQIT